MKRDQLFSSLSTVISSPALISVFKGVVAYVLFFTLFFLEPFQALFPYPATGTSAVLICIAGFPGWSVGACLQSLALGLIGIGIGAVNFYILAQLAPHPVAQGIVFFIILYIGGLIKTASPRYLIGALLCLLMSWNGVYTPFLTTDRRFSPEYLQSYLQAYAWGAAIVLFVNVLIFPHSAEAELRMTLVKSLDHIRTFFYLIEKSFILEITDEEIKVRDGLSQTIRVDFNILQSKLSQTFLGFNYSRWSAAEYEKMVQLTRSMQQSLITAHSSLINFTNIDSQTFADNFLQGNLGNIDVMRKYVYVYGLTEIQKELAVGSASASFDRKERELLKELDLEPGPLIQQPSILLHSVRSFSESSLRMRSVAEEAAEARLRDVENTIALELSAAPEDDEIEQVSLEPAHNPVDPLPSLSKAYTLNTLAHQASSITQTDSSHSARVNSLIRKHWNAFQKRQYDQIGGIFVSGNLYHPQEPLISEALSDSYDFQFQPVKTADSIEAVLLRLASPNLSKSRLSPLKPIVVPASTSKGSGLAEHAYPTRLIPESSEPESQNRDSSIKVDLHRSLMRSYSHSFAVGLFLEELIRLREFISEPLENGQLRLKKFRFHAIDGLLAKRKLRKMAESLDTELQEKAESSPHEFSIREALDMLESREHVPTKIDWLKRVFAAEKFLRSPDSICAFKCACAVTVLSALFWTETTRQFALIYNLNSAVITLVVAITPTLGQSWLSFLFQIGGQGVGLVFGMIILDIFHNVGGYKYNPYGLVCALGMFAIPMCYTIYTNPQLFVMPLLALNSAGGLVYSEFLNQRRPFDSPSLRLGKSLTTLAIAIAIVSCFQLLILRNPGRRTLRKAMAKVMKANTAYTVILQSYVKSTIPTDPSHRPSPKAIQRVAQDLIKREVQIQNDITALMPLMRFAGAEPSFLKPFNAAEYLKIARANQLILDRNRDARIAIGTCPLPEIILKEFVEKLGFYRVHALSRIKTSLYLCTSTLQSKFPLPENLGATTDDEKFGSEIFHDAIVLSSRLARSPEGLMVVKSPELTRYWLYLMSVTSVIYQLEAIQDSAQKLFGKLEDEQFNYSAEMK